MAEQQEMSKGAKRRANKKAREAAETTEDKPAPEPKPETPEPKAKAKGKAKAEAKAEAKPEPKVEPKAKAKAEGKAKAKAEPKGKAEAKSKAQPKDEPQPEATEAPKTAAKPAAKKQASKPKKEAPKVEEEEPKKREPSPDRFLQFDDGTGDAWETCTGVSKKQQKRKERKELEETASKAQAAALGVKQGSVAMSQHVVGLTVSSDKQANTAAKATVSQAVTATAVASAAAVAEKENAPTQPSVITHSSTVKVPDQRIGVVIGPKGATIKMIQEKTGAKLTSESDSCVISGSPEQVAQAEIAVRELIDKGYTALQYEDFQEHFVAVHPSAFPDIIGKQGAVIRKIKDELNVSVNIPNDAPKNAPATKKFKVTLAGKNADVDRAKEVINNIIMYYHDPITHPDMVHEEMEIAQWHLSFVIGSKGSELRHIQNNYKVRMYIPRETSVNKKVVIVGDQVDVDRAKAYIEKLLWNADQAPNRGRGAADQADDGWGDEEEEDWMKDYLYRREKKPVAR